MESLADQHSNFDIASEIELFSLDDNNAVVEENGTSTTQLDFSN